MKILKIRFKNINSLKGAHHIDFTEAPFDNSSLFAITGPTGSGKSTLLDVISLALFNQVPRLGKMSKKEILTKGAILTRNQKEASASVTYQCNEGIFTSHWHISTNRKNQLRDYEMELADEAGTILDVRKSKVPEQNEKLIGLNYDQFIKSVLLAQGEFAQFLKAKKDERGALLEKITGTGIYRELGRKAYERFKFEALKIEKQKDEILTHQQELLDEERFATFTASFHTEKETIAELEKQIKQLEKNIALKESLAKTKKEIVSAEIEQAGARKKMSEFQEGPGLQLVGHEKVRPVADELRAWSRLQVDIAKLDQQLANLSRDKEENEKAIESLMKDFALFIGKGTSPETAEKDMVDFAETVRALEKMRDDKGKEYTNARSIIQEQARETAFKYDQKADNLANLELLQSDSEKNLTHLLKLAGIAETDDVTPFRENLKDKLKRSQQLEKMNIVLAQERKNLLQHSMEAEQIETQQKVLPKDIAKAKEKAGIFENKAHILRLSLENQRLRASLEEHRKNLKRNEPCPLCGSLDHPFAEHLPPQTDKKEGLDEMQKEYEKWNSEFIAKNSELNKLIERKKELEPKIASVSAEINKLEHQETELSKGLNPAPGTTWEEYSQDCQQKLEALTNFESEKKTRSTYEQLRPNLEKLAAITKEGSKLKKRLIEKYNGDNINKDSQDRLTKWTELKNGQNFINKQLHDTNLEAKERREENRSLEKFLKGTDSLREFETVAEASKVLLDERSFGQLQAEKTKINNTLDQGDATIKLLKKQFDLALKSDVPETLDHLLHIFGTKKNELKATQEKRNELERALINHRHKTEKISALKQQIAEEEKQGKRWKLLYELIGDAQGKRFNDFAQDLTLRHLVALANIRLADLSDRYRLDTPTEAEDDGLIALDDHMGGQRRSVKTLSGGETFLLSLSMALALSDLASSNVEINSLFIDEGFGTLDPETLDQTLDTLERLQSESSKTIGIISHVDALKERIATQIQLERNGQGYSTLRIVH